MNKTEVIICIVGILFIIPSIWNAISLYQIKKRPLKNDNLNDSKYFELKYKLEFITAMFIVVFSTGSFLGYDIIEDIKDSTKKEFIDSLSNIRDSIKIYKTDIATINEATVFEMQKIQKSTLQYQDLISSLTVEQQGVKNKILATKDSLHNINNSTQLIQKRIEEINNKPILKRDIYIVIADYIDTLQNEPKRFYFDNLRTIEGDKLPKFSVSPFIQAMSNVGGTYNVMETTTESFLLSTFLYSKNNDQEPVHKRITFLITEDKP